MKKSLSNLNKVLIAAVISAVLVEAGCQAAKKLNGVQKHVANPPSIIELPPLPPGSDPGNFQVVSVNDKPFATARTIPVVTKSLTTPPAFTPLTNVVFCLQFATYSNGDYKLDWTIQSTTNLLTWRDVYTLSDSIASVIAPGPFSYMITDTVPNMNFRLKVTTTPRR